MAEAAASVPLQGEVPWEGRMPHTAGGCKVSAGWGEGAHPHGVDLGDKEPEHSGSLSHWLKRQGDTQLTEEGKDAGCWDGHDSRSL